MNGIKDKLAMCGFALMRTRKGWEVHDACLPGGGTKRGGPYATLAEVAGAWAEVTKDMMRDQWAHGLPPDRDGDTQDMRKWAAGTKGGE